MAMEMQAPLLSKNYLVIFDEMNILNLSSLSLWDLGKGKGRVSTYLPIKGFVDRGHNVYYITNHVSQQAGCFDGITVIKAKTILTNKRQFLDIIVYPFTLLCFLYVSIKICRKHKPDVIYSHTAHLSLPAFILSKIFRAKYVLRLYGVSHVKSMRFKISYLFLYMAFSLKSDMYILTNDGTEADKVALSFGVPQEKIYFLKNGINKEWSTYPINSNLKKQFAPNEEKILLSVSRLANWKQVDWIINVFAKLLKIDTNVRLIIVGEGPEKKYLKQLSIDLKIDDYVSFVGSQLQANIFNYMNMADVFVSMNALSSLSNPVFEAMVCGLPVIALNRGTTSELIKNGENGILIDDEQLGELPRIINNLLENNEERKRIAENGRKTILEQWPSWEERVKKEIDLIENLVDNKV